MRPTIVGFLLVPILAMAQGPQASSYASYDVEPVEAHPEWDAEYTKRIRSCTTGTQFMTDLVDHLPRSESVPTPLAFNGAIAGAEGHLTTSAGVAAYMRALEAASPRVKVFSLGSSEEGREMILVAIADEATITALDDYKGITAALFDPRRTAEAEARRLIVRGKPIYYLTGGLHSPETGSPEMLMELAYRLAVEDTPFVTAIRANVITLITPVLEVDGRDRMVDLFRYSEAHPDAVTPPLVYWGRYVAHDNNRDTIGMALALTRNVHAAVQQWHPQVMHDLHESIPFLYVSSGTGPYNAWLDPLVVGEWERMAVREVQELTAKGLPGVWTHGFYDGWAPGYLFWLAFGHNAVGRFYETFGNVMPRTEDRVVRELSNRAWFRPNPPLPRVRWSLRNNVNFQQSGVLVALAGIASERERSLERYWQTCKRAVAKAVVEGPAAYVFPADQKRRGQLRDLMELLRRHGIEVHTAIRAFDVAKMEPVAAHGIGGVRSQGEQGNGESRDGAKEAAAGEPTVRSFPAGSFVVRMDQPMSRLADALLDTQFVRGDERLYDDAGWTVGYARNLDFTRVPETEVLTVPMQPWHGKKQVDAELARGAAALVVRNDADTDLVRLRAALPGVPMLSAEEPFSAGGEYPVGTVIVPLAGVDATTLETALARLDLRAETVTPTPAVRTHPIVLPRVAVVHTWFSTQDEGWFRLALEDLGIPFDYVATQALAGLGDLRARYDVILIAPFGRASSQDVVNGYPEGPAMPWRRCDLTPNLGVDETDDMRPGLGFSGLESVRRFVQGGGLLVTVGNAAELAVDFGLARYVTVADTEDVKSAGSLIRVTVRDPGSPVAYGYDGTLPVYFDGGPVFTIGTSQGGDRQERRPSGRGSATDPDVPQGRPYVATPEMPPVDPIDEGFVRPDTLPLRSRPYLPDKEDRPRVILGFPEEDGDMLLSGMLEGGTALAGKALVVDCPLGEGHVLLFGNNPMWRHNTQGSWALVTNAMLHYAHLDLGWPPEPAKGTASQRSVHR